MSDDKNIAITKDTLFEIEMDTHDFIIQYNSENNTWSAYCEHVDVDNEEDDYDTIIIQENNESIDWVVFELFNGFVLTINDFNNMKEAYNNLF